MIDRGLPLWVIGRVNMANAQSAHSAHAQSKSNPKKPVPGQAGVGAGPAGQALALPASLALTLAALDFVLGGLFIYLVTSVFRPASPAVMAFGLLLGGSHIVSGAALGARASWSHRVALVMSLLELALGLAVALLMFTTAAQIEDIYKHMGKPWDFVFMFMGVLCFVLFGILPAAKVTVLKLVDLNPPPKY